MKKPFKLFYLILMIGFVGITSSCSSDDPSAPIITFPDNGTIPEVEVGTDIDFTFTVIAEGGYKSHSFKKSGGIINENSSVIGSGTKEFTISGTFTAGDITGPDGITLTVNDNKGLSSTKTMAVLIVSAR